MTALFDIADVNKSASAFNPDKLAWINQQHIMRATPEWLAGLRRSSRGSASSAPRDWLPWPGAAGACQDAEEMAENSLFLLRGRPRRRKSGEEAPRPEARPMLAGARVALAAIPNGGAPPSTLAVQGLADSGGLGLGKVAQPIRVAVSGRGVSPPIDQTLAILGRRDDPAAP